MSLFTPAYLRCPADNTSTDIQTNSPTVSTVTAGCTSGLSPEQPAHHAQITYSPIEFTLIKICGQICPRTPQQDTGVIGHSTSWWFSAPSTLDPITQEAF